MINMQIIEFLIKDRGSLKGHVTIKIPTWGDFIIENIAYFENGDKRWIAFPSRQIEDQRKKVWKPYMRFEDAAMGRKFNEKVLEAIKVYLEIK